MHVVSERGQSGLLHSRSMKMITRLLLMLLPLGCLGTAQAEPADLYAAEVRVADDTLQVRNLAFQKALRKVLVRLSGSADVGGNPAVDPLLARAPSLVQQFRYRVDEAASSAQDEPTGRYLWARFDKASLDRAMREAGIPLWSARRPRVLLWLASESKGVRRLVSLENEPAARGLLTGRARERGMPLQLPLMDLLDQSALSAADLWAGYEAAIREASQRYPHDVILTGRLRDLGGRWEAQWTLLDRDSSESFEARSSTRSAALLSGIDTVQDKLAARYAPSSSAAGEGFTRVRVRGVDSVAAYGRLIAIVGAQEDITRVNVRGVQGGDLYLDLWVRGGPNALTRMLSLGGELFLEPSAEPGIPSWRSDQDSPAAPASRVLPADLTFSFLPSAVTGR